MYHLFFDAIISNYLLNALNVNVNVIIKRKGVQLPGFFKTIRTSLWTGPGTCTFYSNLLLLLYPWVALTEKQHWFSHRLTDSEVIISAVWAASWCKLCWCCYEVYTSSDYEKNHVDMTSCHPDHKQQPKHKLHLPVTITVFPCSFALLVHCFPFTTMWRYM